MRQRVISSSSLGIRAARGTTAGWSRRSSRWCPLVSHGKKVRHHVWAHAQAHVACTLTALHRLAQWYGMPADKDGFVSLSMAKFSW